MTDTRQFDEIFNRTLDDGRLSRNEVKALKKLIEGMSAQQIVQILSRAFRVAGEHLNPTNSFAMLRWIEEVVKALHSTESMASERSNVEEAWFFPETDERGLERLLQLLGGAKKSLDICVFTITDNRISKAIANAHRRGVKVRVISDNDKSYDRGSDVLDLSEEGVPVRIDRTDHHMHHKFAVVDEKLLINGSFNWTRSAASKNHENIQVTSEPSQVEAFLKEFRNLWKKFK